MADTVVTKEEGRYVVEFPLLTDKRTEDMLDLRLELARKVYNQILAMYYRRYNEMIKTKHYRAIKEELAQIRKQKEESGVELKKRTPRERELFTQLNTLYRDNGFTKFDMISVASKWIKPFRPNLDSSVGNKIGTRLWTAWNKFLFGNGSSVHFQKYGNFNSIESSTNKSGIRFKHNLECAHWVGPKPAVIWNGLKIPVKVNESRPYEVLALRDEICYCRIVRRFVRNKNRYYVQLTLKGKPPVKVDKNGELLRQPGKGVVGINVGLQTVSVVTDGHIYFFDLCDRVQKFENEKVLIQQALDRSRRANNPDNFNEDGTIKKGIVSELTGKRERLHWNTSKRYVKLQGMNKELYRKQAIVRKLQHTELANFILTLGDHFVFNDVSWKSMSMRKKETTVDENGAFESKKRYGSLVADKSPSLFIDILTKKAEAFGCQVTKLSPSKLKGAEEIFKNSHKSRKNTLFSDAPCRNEATGCIDNLYGAYLLYVSQEEATMEFEQFKKLHDSYIKELIKEVSMK